MLGLYIYQLSKYVYMMSNIMLPFNYMKLANVIYIKEVLTRFKDSYKI